MENNEEDRKARLAELLKKNKIRLARIELAEKYEREFHTLLTSENFFDLDQSNMIKRDVYLKIAKLQGQHITTFQDTLGELNKIKEKTKLFSDDWVFCYYLDTIYTGGIKIKMADFWKIISYIGQKPKSEIVVVAENFIFGICVEILEYDYLITHWGF